MHRRSEATAAGDCGAPSAVLDGEHEHGMQEREAKLMALLVRSEGAERGEKRPRLRRAQSSAMAAMALTTATLDQTSTCAKQRRS